MSFTADLIGGIGELLATKGIGVWRPTGTFTAGETAIVAATVPATPDRVITLTAYAAADDPTLSDSTVSVQVRTRGTKDPRTVDDLDDAVFDALQNLPRVTVAGITVVGAWRTSGTYLGVDGNGRHSRSSNYRLLVHRPSTNRT